MTSLVRDQCSGRTNKEAAAREDAFMRYSVHKDPLLATKGIKSLVKRFKDELTKLDTLELALSSRGNVATPCVTIPVDGKKCFPHLFYYNIFVEDGCNKHEISSIPECKFSFEKKTDFICINPYHLFKGKDNFSLAKDPIYTPKKVVTHIKKASNNQIDNSISNYNTLNSPLNTNNTTKPISPNNNHNVSPYSPYNGSNGKTNESEQYSAHCNMSSPYQNQVNSNMACQNNFVVKTEVNYIKQPTTPIQNNYIMENEANYAIPPMASHVNYRQNEPNFIPPIIVNNALPTNYMQNGYTKGNGQVASDYYSQPHVPTALYQSTHNTIDYRPPYHADLKNESNIRVSPNNMIQREGYLLGNTPESICNSVSPRSTNGYEQGYSGSGNMCPSMYQNHSPIGINQQQNFSPAMSNISSDAFINSHSQFSGDSPPDSNHSYITEPPSHTYLPSPHQINSVHAVYQTNKQHDINDYQYNSTNQLNNYYVEPTNISNGNTHYSNRQPMFTPNTEYRIPSVEYGNPMSTGSSNPNSNMSNNPNSNMSNKPNSNMSVNPRSHCSINPGSNCSINPSSNGNMDPRSNISINPLSNSTIDPHSSMSINPNSNISNATSNSNTSTIKETQNSLEAELDIFEKIYEATSTMLGSSYGNTEQVTTSDFSSTITTETTPYTNHYKSASILSNANNSMNSSNEDSLGPRHSNNPTSTHSALPTQKNYDVTNSVQTYYPYSVESNQSPSLESALYLNSEETNDPTSVQSLYPNSVDPYLISEEYRYSAPPSHSTQTSLLSNQTSLINPFSVESGMTDNSSQPASNQTIYYMPEEYVPSEINESVEDGDCRKSNFPTNSSNLTIDKMIKGTNSDITKDSNVEIKDNTNVFITSMEDEIIQLTNEKVQTNDGRQVTTDNDVVNVPDNGDDNNFNSGINSLTNSTNNQNDEGSENNSDDDGPNKEFEKLFNGEEPMDEADIMYKPVKDELNVIKVLKVPGIYLNPIDGSNESKYPVFVQDTVDEMMTKKEKAEKDFGQDLYSRFNKVLTKAKQFRPLVPTTDYLNKSNEGRYFISALTKNEIKRKSIVFSNGYMEMEDISTITRPAPLDEIALLPTKCVCKLMQYSLGSSHHTSDAIGIDVTPFYIDGSECYGAKNRFNLKSDPRYLHSARRMEIIKQVGIDGVRIDSYKQDLFITNLSNVKIYVKGFRWLEQGQKEAIHCLHFGAVLKVFDMNEFVINLHANVDQQKLVCIANSFDAMELNDREVVEDDNAKPKRMHKKTGALQKMSHIEISIGERWGENTNYARCRDTPVGIEIVLNQQKSYLQRMINEARNEISLADIEWNTIC